MPAVFISSESTIRTLGNDHVEDVQRFTYQAIPSGVVFSFIPNPPAPVTGPQNVGIPGSIIDYGSPQDSADVIHGDAEGWAARWNDHAAQPGVVAITTTQELGPTGSLVDICYVTVSSSSGRSTSLIRGGTERFYAPGFNPWVEGERARLDAIEAANPGEPQFGA